MLEECVALAVENIRAVKEHACRRGPRDTSPQVTVFRGSEPIAVVVMAKTTREDIVHMANACTTGFDADVLILAVDTYQATPPAEVQERALAGDPEAIEKTTINPMTGRQWQHGEIQEVAVLHNGIERGWVTEAMSVVGVNRAGDALMTAATYRFSGRHLVWTDSDSRISPAQGFIPDALIAGMNHPSVSVMAPQVRAALGRDRMDADFAQFLIEQRHGAALLIAPVRGSRAEAFRRAGYRPH